MTCIYRHCLPPGYVFKKKNAPKVEEEEKDTVEQEIDRLIAALPTNGTKMTLENFNIWKEKKLKQKEID